MSQPAQKVEKELEKEVCSHYCSTSGWEIPQKGKEENNRKTSMLETNIILNVNCNWKIKIIKNNKWKKKVKKKN